MLNLCQVDQRDTHRLIPAQFADHGASVLSRLTDNEETLSGIFELDDATNDRLLAESGRLPGIDQRELVFGIPAYRIINAAFCHPSLKGRFNSPDRGAWYAGFELETAQAEVAYHKQVWLQETAWKEGDVADYVDYLADFRTEFHDIRGLKEHEDCLSPNNRTASQALSTYLLNLGSSGVIYPSARRPTGICIACFRPVLVANVHPGNTFTFTFSESSVQVTSKGTD